MIELPTESTAYLWFDTEYSSLDLSEAHLLQVAMVITDVHLQRILPPEHDVNIYLRVPEGVSISPWVKENMPELIKKCQSDDACSLQEADERLSSYIDQAVVVPLGDDKKKPILAGNSIHSDWYLALKYLPKMYQRIHYRHLDVTTLKLQWQDYALGEAFEKDDPELVQEGFPGFVLNDASKLHDAYYDCQASAAELAFYRKQLLRKSAADQS